MQAKRGGMGDGVGRGRPRCMQANMRTADAGRQERLPIPPADPSKAVVRCRPSNICQTRTTRLLCPDLITHLRPPERAFWRHSSATRSHVSTCQGCRGRGRKAALQALVPHKQGLVPLQLPLPWSHRPTQQEHMQWETCLPTCAALVWYTRTVGSSGWYPKSFTCPTCKLNSTFV